MKPSNFETLAWVLGVISLALGCGLQWGYPAALIALGAIFGLWPLAKNFAR